MWVNCSRGNFENLCPFYIEVPSSFTVESVRNRFGYDCSNAHLTSSCVKKTNV